jgi:hypothetical protein
MSALGQKQTLGEGATDVRFTPKKRTSLSVMGMSLCANTGHFATVRYCLVLFGGGSGGSQAESSGPEASASIRASSKVATKGVKQLPFEIGKFDRAHPYADWHAAGGRKT